MYGGNGIQKLYKKLENGKPKGVSKASSDFNLQAAYFLLHGFLIVFLLIGLTFVY